MLKSMTGFGATQRSVDGLQLDIEVKTVNSRFLKTSVKVPGFLAAQESMLEACMKERLRRGHATLSVFVRKANSDEAAVSVNEAVVKAYQAIFLRLGIPLESVPTLPGVVGTPDQPSVSDAVLVALRAGAEEALARLDAMRCREGAGLTHALREMCANMEALRVQVQARAPHVVLAYQQKLQARLAQLLAGADVPVDAASLAREMALFADRCDIAEELTRLGLHLEHVLKHLDQDVEVGRTLDFLAQEMHREVNTMGAKSADAEISQWVVALKSELERFKEQVANVQ